MNGTDGSDATGTDAGRVADGDPVSDGEAGEEGDVADAADATDVAADDPLTDSQLAAMASRTSAVSTAELVVPDGAESPKRLSSVLVAVGGGPHSGATVDVARELAADGDAWMELFHVRPLAEGDREDDGDAERDADASESSNGVRSGTEAGGAGEDAAPTDDERLLDAAASRLGAFDRVDRWLVEHESAAAAIVEQSAYYDAVVVGAPTTGTVGRFVFGSTTETVTEEAEVPVVVVEADGEAPLLDD